MRPTNKVSPLAICVLAFAFCAVSAAHSSVFVVAGTGSEDNRGNGHQKSGEQMDRSRASSNQSPVSANAGASFDMGTLFEYGMNPVGSALKTFLPNTMGGINSDLSNGYSMLANQGQSGYGAVKSNYDMMNESANQQVNSMQQQMANGYSTAGDTLRRVYGILANPQQFCQNVAAQTQQAYETVSQQMPQQASSSYGQSGQAGSSFGQSGQASSSLGQSGQNTNSFMGKGGFSFGRR